MLDCNPVQRRTEIAARLVHELTRELRQATQFRPILGRDDETEVVAIFLAAFRERADVCAVPLGVKHATWLAVAGHAVALQVGQVSAQRARCA